MEETLGIILAAGLGTRLGRLSDERPKPLLPVCNQPLVRWALALLREHRVRDIAVNLHHLGQLIREALDPVAEHDPDLTLHYSPEPEILGTGGGIKAMAAIHPRRTCIVVNGKLVTDVNLQAVVRHHQQQGYLATMVLCPHPDPTAWGAVTLDERDRIVKLLDVDAPGSHGGRDYLFTGIHVIEPELIDAIPTGSCCVIRTAYATLLRRGAPLGGYVHSGYFYEHSTPARYLQGNLNLLAGDLAIPAAPGPLRGIHPSAHVDPSACVAEAALIDRDVVVEASAVVGPGVVAGEGCRIGEGVELERCVLWPHVDQRTRASDAIITPRQQLAVDLNGDPLASPHSSQTASRGR
jgi:NDP-sugar pyrophosphorylase family protein